MCLGFRRYKIVEISVDHEKNIYKQKDFFLCPEFSNHVIWLKKWRRITEETDFNRLHSLMDSGPVGIVAPHKFA